MSNATQSQQPACQTCQHWRRRTQNPYYPRLPFKRTSPMGLCNSSKVEDDTDRIVAPSDYGQLYADGDILVEPQDLESTFHTRETFACIHYQAKSEEAG